MAQYLVRVELFGANAKGYEDLHERMEALGLKRTVTFTGGVIHEMPTGTYFGPSGLDVTALRDRVRATAATVSPHKDPAIFACQIKDQEWSAFLYPA